MPGFCTMIEVIMQKTIQVVAKCLRITEILVEIDFREQEGQILEVLPLDRFTSLLVNLISKLHDMLVVKVQLFYG